MKEPTAQHGDGRAASGATARIDVLVDLLADQERAYRSMQSAVYEARDLTDLAAKTRKMHGTFGSALRAEIQGRMIEDMEGVHFWQMQLFDMLVDIDQRAKALHDDLRAAKEARVADDKVLRDVMTYLLNRSIEDDRAGALADRLTQMLGDERGPDHG